MNMSECKNVHRPVSYDRGGHPSVVLKYESEHKIVSLKGLFDPTVILLT